MPKRISKLAGLGGRKDKGGRPQTQEDRVKLTCKLPRDLDRWVRVAVVDRNAGGTRPDSPDNRPWDLGDVIADALRLLQKRKR